MSGHLDGFMKKDDKERLWSHRWELQRMTFLIVCVAAMRCGKARGRATLPGVETARHCSRPLKELPNLKPLVRHRTTLPAPAEARWEGPSYERRARVQIVVSTASY